MTLKAKIQNDFLNSMRNRDEVVKSTLRTLKSQIANAEKANGNQELDEAGVLKVVMTAVKQRKQSIEEFNKGNRADLADKETAELAVLEAYLPAKMTDDELRVAAAKALVEIPVSNRAQRIGKAIGAVTRAHQGSFEPAKLKSILEELVPA